MASLFSGCGGFDLGFEEEGFQPIAAFDIDPCMVEVYNTNVANVAHVCDLSTHTPSVKPDVLLAGSPCQGFSTAGKCDPDDPRNGLLIRAGEIALALEPKVFVLENVPAAISGRHGSRWGQVESMLTEGGYTVRRFLAEGAESGVPQLRRRLFLIAWRGSDSIQCDLDPIRPQSLDSVLNGIGDLSGHDPTPLPTGSREQLIAHRIAPGQKLCNVRISASAVPTWDIPEVFGQVSEVERRILAAIVRLRRRNRRRDFGDADPVLEEVVSSYMGRNCSSEINRLLEANYLRRVDIYIDLKHTYNGKFRRLSSKGLAPTVDTHFGDPALFLHPKQDRGLTPREAARIQGFPDSFNIYVGRKRSYRMIGNAVPPPMAKRLAKFVREALIPASIP